MNFNAMMRIRGAAKVVLFSVALNAILTTVFHMIAEQISPGVPREVISAFSFTTSMLVGFWLQGDARRAYVVARENGFIVRHGSPAVFVSIKDDCPKRWLVELYIELNPSLTKS